MLKVRGVVYIPANVMVTQDALYTTFDAASPHETASIYTTTGTVVTVHTDDRHDHGLDTDRHDTARLRRVGPRPARDVLPPGADVRSNPPKEAR